MLTHTEIENLLSYFINLVEKDGLSAKRQSVLNPEDVGTDYNDQTETVKFVHYFEDGPNNEMKEVLITWVFPDILLAEILREKEYLFAKILDLITYTQYLKKDELLDQIAKRLESIINSANSNTLVKKYTFINDALNEILLFITKDYINNLPPSEMLFVKRNRTTTVLLFTLLEDAGLLHNKHIDGDIAKFISARVSYYDEESKRYKRIVDAKQLISKFRNEELPSVDKTLTELTELLKNTPIRINKK